MTLSQYNCCRGKLSVPAQLDQAIRNCNLASAVKAKALKGKALLLIAKALALALKVSLFSNTGFMTKLGKINEKWHIQILTVSTQLTR